MPAKHTEVTGDHDKPRRRLSIFKRCTRLLRPLRFPSSKGRSSIVMSTVGGFTFYLFTLVFPSLNPLYYLNSSVALSGESVSSSIIAENSPIFSADSDANSKTIELPIMDSNPAENIKGFSSYNDEKPSADDSEQPAAVLDPQNIPSSAIGPMEVVAESSSDEPEKNVAKKPDPQKIPSSAITPMAVAVNDRPYPINVDKNDQEAEQPEEDEHNNEETGNRQINLEDLRKEEEDAMAELAKKEYEASAKKNSKKQYKTKVIQPYKIYSKRRESYNNDEAKYEAAASQNQEKEEERDGLDEDEHDTVF